MDKTRKLYCYSHDEFDNLMEEMGWTDHPGIGVSTISICSKNEDDPYHWFENDVNEGCLLTNFNTDFDDVAPFWFGNCESKIYDDTLKTFLRTDGASESNKFFNYLQTYDDSYVMLHAMDYEQAFELAIWIEKQVHNKQDIYVHCSAGMSRSQGVVRYILDTYYDIDWKTRNDNPCLTPNMHVVMMLKRAKRWLDWNDWNYRYLSLPYNYKNLI